MNRKLMAIYMSVSLIFSLPAATNKVFAQEPAPVVLDVQEEIVEPVEKALEQAKKVKVVEEPTTIDIPVPTGTDNSFKAYMDYRTITDTSSKQWSMQQEAYTDENGLRKIGEYYCVALGSGISSELGSKFEITLDSGKTFKVITADAKADCHTDSSNRYVELSNGRINVVEFIVHDDYMPDIVRVMGNVDHMPGEGFNGQIVGIREIIE